MFSDYMAKVEERRLEIARCRVKDGVLFLDRHAPEDWRERIRRNRFFHVGRNYECPLALSFKGTELVKGCVRLVPKNPYSRGMQTSGDVVRAFRESRVFIDMDILGFFSYYDQEGVSCEHLTKEWKKELGMNA